MVHADPEFKALKDMLPMIETSGADNQIPDIERMMWTTKDRARSAHSILPCSRTQTSWSFSHGKKRSVLAQLSAF